MRLGDRFKVLKDGGVIDRDTHDSLVLLLMRFEEYWHLPINDDNGAGLMTYLALMLMRFKRGEVTAAMSESVYEEIKGNTEAFQKSEKIIDDIESILKIQIPLSERQYLQANLHTILNPDMI
ncbi:PRD domain-containing protein [Entomospira entomophila]|uniref:PRD domain-containing protein n=1 Tax=Entomospira entomophila TaxID=2719988 RepID=A0A968KQR0_9SPIO|nr:PRD domain-containing protein [Entomospira entomophilus]NIZ40049.1 PRD domain-containing protein [Entomospira entomophilus]WDI35610.1 PRD domain-containing protein [Entomospira entomophilus]